MLSFKDSSSLCAWVVLLLFHRTGISSVNYTWTEDIFMKPNIREGPSSGPLGMDSNEDRLLGTHVGSLPRVTQIPLALSWSRDPQ